MQGLDSFLPQDSIAKIKGWLKKYDCQLSIKSPRSTKLGDYKFYKGKHFISINNNLNSYAFLITLVHEIAHMIVRENYSNRVLPHGKEWKYTFKILMLDFLPLFPENIQKQLALHLKNPKASTSTDIALVKVLREYDNKTILTIEDIPIGSTFLIPNGKAFIKGKKVRTRFECISLKNNKTYLISPLAEVMI